MQKFERPMEEWLPTIFWRHSQDLWWICEVLRKKKNKYDFKIVGLSNQKNVMPIYWDGTTVGAAGKDKCGFGQAN